MCERSMKNKQIFLSVWGKRNEADHSRDYELWLTRIVLSRSVSQFWTVLCEPSAHCFMAVYKWNQFLTRLVPPPVMFTSSVSPEYSPVFELGDPGPGNWEPCTVTICVVALISSGQHSSYTFVYNFLYNFVYTFAYKRISVLKIFFSVSNNILKKIKIC